MFQYAVKIHKFENAANSSDNWELPKSFALPSFAKLDPSNRDKIMEPFRMAWSNTGIYLQSQLKPGEYSALVFRFFFDTRGATGNKRLTRFCINLALN